ncbi:MAG TPA: restriction endonuclease [Thermoanaerobaculia bacterium]|nr:restriction endonuclease [Thermoanaerobaculia bacterium]
MSAHTVLDYSQYISGYAEHLGRSPDVDQQSEFISNKGLFFALRGWCPYCGAQSSLIYDTGNRDAEPSLEDGWSSPKISVWTSRAWSCPSCGWWEVETIQKWAGEPYADETELCIYHASLRHFDITSKEIPVATLIDHLASSPQSIEHISPYKMERLVEAVFREHYHCEAVHCGRSNDGGLDLILIDGDEPIAVQVKRRERRSRTESVVLIREFLGACLLGGYTKGIIVTSAHDFSPAARLAAHKAVTKDLVDSFELVNGDELIRRLDLVASAQADHWKPLTKEPRWGEQR